MLMQETVKTSKYCNPVVGYYVIQVDNIFQSLKQWKFKICNKPYIAMCLVYGQFKDCRLCQSGLGFAFAKLREKL